MISEEEARSKMLGAIQLLPSRRLPSSEALGYFAAEDYLSRLPLPSFDNSAMDGYAVVASSCKKGERLRVTGEQPAGPDRRLRVAPGEAARIFTGAPVRSCRGTKDSTEGGANWSGGDCFARVTRLCRNDDRR